MSKAYTTIIGERSYQEVADALAQLTTDRDEWKQEALSAQERFKQAEARAAIAQP